VALKLPQVKTVGSRKDKQYGIFSKQSFIEFGQSSISGVGNRETFVFV